MTKIKLVTLTAVVICSAFFGIIYTSCNKDKCKGVVCQNGATSCIDGTCQCPSGYSGNFCELSSIVFKNDSYTPIYITVSGSSTTIAVDSSVSFVGASGSGVSIFAYTYGTNATNAAIGDTIFWNMNGAFPTNGLTATQPLDVLPQYFYLKVIDSNSSQSIDSINVNYNITGAQMPNSVNVPNDRHVHGIGYYVSYPLTEIYIASSTGYHWMLTPPAIPDSINNLSITVTVN